MNIYVIQIILIVICMLFIKDEKRWFAMCAIFLCLVLALRNRNIGTDLSRYYYHFSVTSVQTISEIVSEFRLHNSGFYVFTHFLNILTNGNYQFYLVIVSLITILPVFKLIKHYSYDCLFSLLCYVCLGYYSFQFSGLKQAIAMAILCFAFSEILNKRIFRFFLFVLIAACFHLPALIFLPAYYIANEKSNIRYIVLLCIFCALLLLFRSEVVAFMADEYSSVIDFTGSIKAGGKVILIGIIAAFGYVVSQRSDNDYYGNLLFRFMITAMPIQLLSVFGNVFERLADYYFFFVILYIPYAVSFTENNILNNSGEIVGKNRGMVTIVVIISLLAYFNLYIYSTPEMLPYKTWLF